MRATLRRISCCEDHGPAGNRCPARRDRSSVMRAAGNQRDKPSTGSSARSRRFSPRMHLILHIDPVAFGGLTQKPQYPPRELLRPAALRAVLEECTHGSSASKHFHMCEEAQAALACVLYRSKPTLLHRVLQLLSTVGRSCMLLVGAPAVVHYVWLTTVRVTSQSPPKPVDGNVFSRTTRPGSAERKRPAAYATATFPQNPVAILLSVVGPVSTTAPPLRRAS